MFLVASARALLEWKPTSFLTIIIPQSSWSKYISFLEHTIAFTYKAFTYSVTSIWNAVPLFHSTRLRFIYSSDTQLMSSYHGPRTVLASGEKDDLYSVIAFEKLEF